MSHSSLLGGEDEPKTLPYAISLFCSISADGEQSSKKPIKNRELWISLDKAMSRHKVQTHLYKPRFVPEEIQRAQELAGPFEDRSRIKEVNIGFEYALPSQNTHASQFQVNEQGQIEQLEQKSTYGLLDTAAQREDYFAMRSDIAEALELGQQLGIAQAQLEDLANALPEDFASARVFSIWRAGNRLRRTLNAHEAIKESIDPSSARLDGEAAETIGFVLDTFNNFAFSDPKMRSRDLRRIPPQDWPAVQNEFEEAAELIQDGIASDIATAAVNLEISDEIRNAMDADDTEHHYQAVEQANLQIRNVIAAVISGTAQICRSCLVKTGNELKTLGKEYKAGIYRATGAATATWIGSEIAGYTAYHTKLIDYVVRNAPELKVYVLKVWNSPAVTQTIDWIVKLFS